VIAALFVEADGCYFGLPNVDPWDIDRDARNYNGPHPIVGHPPCERWGRYWYGGPSCKERKLLGSDGGCFRSALRSVQRFGGVLEHPEASHAWRAFSLNAPPWNGGWVAADDIGGWTCCVSQANYGHDARKMTWLYVFGMPFDKLPSLKWGAPKASRRMEDSYRSRADRREGMRNRHSNGSIENRLGHKARARTPLPFRDLLISIARECDPSKAKPLQELLFTLTPVSSGLSSLAKIHGPR
jgi:hypothetical protein